MKYYIEIDDRDIDRFRVDNPCKGSHGNPVLVLRDKHNMSVGFELKVCDQEGGERMNKYNKYVSAGLLKMRVRLARLVDTDDPCQVICRIVDEMAGVMIDKEGRCAKDD